MAEYNQIARQEYPSTDAARQGMTDVSYVYMDERMRTFMITLALEEDGEERVLEELRLKVEGAEAGGAKRIEI